MEAWAIVALVLGTNLIQGLLTFFINKKQMKHSEKQLERQIAAQSDKNSLERRRDVRSQPLLELRTE